MEFVQNFPVYLGHVEIRLIEKRENITKNLINQNQKRAFLLIQHFLQHIFRFCQVIFQI